MSRDGSVETWSSRFEEPGLMPAACADMVAEAFPDFPYCVRAPASRGMRGSEPETFLCQALSRVLVIKKRRSGYEKRLFELADVDALETATTLLASRMSFYLRGGDRVSLLYNTVSSYFFVPMIAAFRRYRALEAPPERRVRSIRPDPFADLVRTDYKYHSYAVEVMGDDELAARFYHPETPVPRFLDSSRIISSYILTLSPSMFYGISEEPPFRSKRMAEYSHMTRYVPLDAGVRFEYVPLADERRYRMLELRSGGARFRYPLAAGEAERFDRFEEAVRNAAAAERSAAT
ncbi:MAG TPA: hypothetical protein VMV90_00055 [Rectinemataceae bacterium]|nr:hypothetical protein [Rectinemataceae bacterium]